MIVHFTQDTERDSGKLLPPGKWTQNTLKLDKNSCGYNMLVIFKYLFIFNQIWMMS